MKTKKSLFTLILALAVAFSFFSCEEKAETPDASSLVGTVWFASGTYSEPGYGITTWSATVSFLTSSTGAYMIRDGDDPDPGTFTYTYTPPKVVLTDDGGQFDEPLEGTISGNTLTIKDVDGTTRTLTKQ